MYLKILPVHLFPNYLFVMFLFLIVKIPVNLCNILMFEWVMHPSLESRESTEKFKMINHVKKHAPKLKTPYFTLLYSLNNYRQPDKTFLFLYLFFYSRKKYSKSSVFNIKSACWYSIFNSCRIRKQANKQRRKKQRQKQKQRKDKDVRETATSRH